MELIGTGILLAIGFYIVPIVLTLVVGVVGGFFILLGSIFSGSKK